MRFGTFRKGPKGLGYTVATEVQCRSIPNSFIFSNDLQMSKKGRLVVHVLLKISPVLAPAIKVGENLGILSSSLCTWSHKLYSRLLPELGVEHKQFHP